MVPLGNNICIWGHSALCVYTACSVWPRHHHPMTPSLFQQGFSCPKTQSTHICIYWVMKTIWGGWTSIASTYMYVLKVDYYRVHVTILNYTYIQDKYFVLSCIELWPTIQTYGEHVGGNRYDIFPYQSCLSCAKSVSVVFITWEIHIQCTYTYGMATSMVVVQHRQTWKSRPRNSHRLHCHHIVTILCQDRTRRLDVLLPSFMDSESNRETCTVCC